MSKPIAASHGYGDAEIFFLGGYPIGSDLAQGMALSGSIETSLNQFLRPHRLNVKNTYRSLWIKEKLEYSGTNPKRLREALQQIDLTEYSKQLLEEIRDVNPTVIVPLDDIALRAVYPYISTIKKPKGRKHWVYCYRGSVIPLREDWQVQCLDKIKIIPIIGPQLQYYDSIARLYTTLDFKKIVEEKNHREVSNDYGMVWVCRSATEFDRFLSRQIAKQPVRVSFDIETRGSLISCISFCFDGWEAVSVPLFDSEVPVTERVVLMQMVSKILNSHLEKNNQNIKYDWSILERHGFNICNVRSDTMLKGGVLYPELPKGLDFYTSIYTKIPYYKDEGKEFDPSKHSKDRYYLYNAKDALAAHICADGMDKELEEEPELKSLYKNEIAPSILIYKNIDNRGIQIDNAQKTKLLEKYKHMYESNELILQTLVNNDKFNAKSPKQVGELLYEQLKYPTRKKTNEDGGISYKTDKSTLDDLLVHHPESNTQGKIGFAILNRLIVCRKLAKVIEYISTPLHPDESFRGVYNLAGTETGRSSCSKTIDERFRLPGDSKSTRAMKRLGRSLQTISKHGFAIDEEVFDDFKDKELANDIRSMFVPRKDFVFIEGDGAGAEARVVFVLADDLAGLAAMDQKPKIHAKTAGAIFGIDPNTITKDYPKVPRIGIAYYDLGKRIRHAGNYMMGGFRLSQMTQLPLKFCNDAIDKFHETDPNIRGVFHAEVERAGKAHRRLITPFGRGRTFFAGWSDSTLKEMIAYIPQSTISDQTKFTMWRIVNELEGYLSRFYFLAEMHDGILAEVHKDYKEAYIETFKKVYERPILFNRGTITRDVELVIPVEIAVSDTNWMELKEVHI